MKNFSWYIAYRYFISKKQTQAVSIIMYASLTAIAISTCAMFIILSAFSGLEKLNIRFISEVNPDIKLSPAKGKILNNIGNLEKILSEEKEVNSFSRVIEEKVYISHSSHNDKDIKKDEVAYLKGIDENFTKVVRIDTCVQAGDFLSFKYVDEMIMGDALAYRMTMILDSDDNAQLYMPKPGKGLIKNTSDAFISKDVYLSGVFYINDQYENYIFAPIELSEELLDLPKGSASAIEIKLKNKQKSGEIKESLKQKLGTDYEILTREEQDASYLKMMKIEQLFVYLIFILIIIISSFNLAGAIIIIILDKKTQSRTLLSMGFSMRNLKSLFFKIGFIITIAGLFIGILLGSIISWIQKTKGIIMANPLFPFPISINTTNYIIVIITVLIIGLFISYVSSRRIKTD